jgi:hypothetical protein
MVVTVSFVGNGGSENKSLVYCEVVAVGDPVGIEGYFG